MDVWRSDNCGIGAIIDLSGQKSHQLLKTSLSALMRLSHRGGVAADGVSGDGAGVLMQIDHDYFRQENMQLPGRFCLGVMFIKIKAKTAKQLIEAVLLEHEVELLAWRKVPVNEDCLGEFARHNQPEIVQFFIPDNLNIKACIELRKALDQALAEGGTLISLSNETVIYKGLLKPADLPKYYLDLTHKNYQTAFCIFHQRFSTNTLPEWELAQPFRMLAHNGEINTISANKNAVRARFNHLQHHLKEYDWLCPQGSDSHALDNMLEVLTAGGMELKAALGMLLPPAWEQHAELTATEKAFYEYQALKIEPWGGPAAVLAADGKHFVAALDANGLRPLRYVISDNQWLTLSSEVGIWDYDATKIKEKGRLGPGQMLALPLDKKPYRLLHSEAIRSELMKKLVIDVALLPPRVAAISAEAMNDSELDFLKKRHQVTQEELVEVLPPLAHLGQEAVSSMGDDIPWLVFSRQDRNLFDAFRQRFAQVTNPPIDPLRERAVMSLTTYLGAKLPLLSEEKTALLTAIERTIKLASPLLSVDLYRELCEVYQARCYTIALSYKDNESLTAGLRRICLQAKAAFVSGCDLLIFSDRHLQRNEAVIHPLLVAAVLQKAFIDDGIRAEVSFIFVTGAVRDAHQLAVMVGLGVDALYPYLGSALALELAKTPQEAKTVVKNYYNGLEKGLLKIMSKSGIATLASYRGSGLFDIIGLAECVMQYCFGRSKQLGALDFKTIESLDKRRIKIAQRDYEPLALGGQLRSHPYGEQHAFAADVIQALQIAVKKRCPEAYQHYSRVVNERHPLALRDVLALDDNSVNIIAKDHVEEAALIIRRFDSAAMSIGALSPEAHEMIALAMNRLGARSNSGEGGEAIKRLNSATNSKIKQVASGRFGVTTRYLMSAEVIQIKIAQGAKPGEGGQLPGDKVTPFIAELRYTLPGTALISPPPHHDIYSIEDLAQLIYDLKAVNPVAKIAVKLVALKGVGTIAIGVVKAGANIITLSGYDGGTGASPLTSTQHAGSCWELGLIETHRMLVESGLRAQVLLQVDGGLKTGLDVIKAALLGAQSFGFGTVPMVALGCKYLRICHLNNCATGVATQNQQLRKQHFHGQVDSLMFYFQQLAEEVRDYLARLGFSRLEEVIGRADLLHCQRKEFSQELSQLLLNYPSFSVFKNKAKYKFERVVDKNNKTLNQTIVDDVLPFLAEGQPLQREYNINNTDRSVGATLAGVLVSRFNEGELAAPISLNFTGVAGQSFGAWSSVGMMLSLFGDANDYVAKGLSGGRVILKPVSIQQQAMPIMGNACLYGATSGALFAAGYAGERFAVRNSGAVAVVEGVGDHCCEYMTGGVVIVLGAFGHNFAAGMSGGVAFVVDENDRLATCLNTESVVSQPILECDERIRAQFIHYLAKQLSYTESMIANNLINNKKRLNYVYMIRPKKYNDELIIKTMITVL